MNGLKIYSPYDQKVIQEIALNTSDDVEGCLKIAQQLFEENRGGLPAFQRIEILERTALLLKEQFADLIDIATSEGGKPFTDTEVEVHRAINGVKIAAQSISQIYGEQIPMGLTSSSTNRLAFTIKEPIGVVVAISAFNHPLNLIVHQVATAIASGCPVIVKPALTTPLSCLKFVEILKEAGLPDNWCQVIICEDILAEKLATDYRVNYLTFIGSAKVGWHLRSKLAKGTRCAMEHGGVAPVIIDKDLDLDKLVNPLLKGSFYHAGQVCVSVQKVYAEESICKAVVEKLTAKTKELIVGNPLEKNTQLGPLILPKEVDRVEQWVLEAIDEGAELIHGGKRISETCFEPTILLNPSSNSKVSNQEIFGPVICIYSYKNVDEVINEINQLPFAFQASIFTNNVDFALGKSKAINASAVMINDHTAFRVDWMPFGGRDESGIGVGGIQHTVNEMTREKLIVFKSDEL